MDDLEFVRRLQSLLKDAEEEIKRRHKRLRQANMTPEQRELDDRREQMYEVYG